MAVSQKKRFQILERDGFSCKFCGRKPPFVQLEVDHIIPKKEGGDDSTENLHTTCFDCNRGKGGKVKGESKKDLYKTKIYDNALRAKKFFYDEWNKKFMGSICEKTKTLLSMYINGFIVDNDAYCGRLNFPPLFKNLSVPLMEDGRFDFEGYNSKFKLGESWCDEVLDVMFDEIKGNLEFIIERVFADSNWNSKRVKQYGEKLNYYLTEDLVETEKEYVIRKFTLFPKLIGKKDQ